jgi:hypothetical protein
MIMTFADCKTEIRDAISDNAEIRWSDTVLRSFAFSWEMDLVGRHPEAQYRVRVSNPTPVLLTANTQEFTVSDDYRESLIHFCAFKALGGDSDDAANLVLSREHFKLYLASTGDKE